MALPNVIIAGPPKSGTTSLFEWLAEHPDVLASSVKETYYFYDDANADSPFPNYNANGWEKYESLFKGHTSEKVILEASPGYIFAKLAAEKLTEIADLKMILIHRKAADRLFSDFQFNKYKTKKFNGSFANYLGYDGRHFGNKVLGEADLTTHIERWTKHMDPSRVRIIRFDELSADPLLTMQKLATFLGIDAGYYTSYAFSRKNETFGLKNRPLHLLALKIKRYTPSIVQKLITPIYYSFNKTAIPPVSVDEKRL